MAPRILLIKTNPVPGPRLYLLGLLFGLLLSTGSALAQSRDGLFLKQQSKRYGSISSFITNKGVRMDAMGIKIFVAPPYRTISMYNAANKSVYRTTVKEIGDRVNLLKLTPKEKARGMKEAIKVEASTEFFGLKLSHTLMEHVDRRGKHRPVLRIFSTHDAKLPRALEDACCQLTSCPPGYGLPVKLYMWSKGVQEQLLETTKVERRQLSERLFVEPQGYKTVSDEMQLMMDEEDLKGF